jgi:hypothetical protein
MSWFAWALVLAGAVCHALWNLIAKQVASTSAQANHDITRLA